MEKDKIIDIGLSIMEGRGIEWVQETDNCILYKCNQYGYYFITDLEGSIIVPPGKYSYIDKFWKGYSRVNIEDNSTGIKKWGIIDSYGFEIVPLCHECIWRFYGRDYDSTYMRMNGTAFWFDLKEGFICQYDPYPPKKKWDENRNTHEEKPKYGEFEGTYAQSVMGFSDDVINDAFDGEPDAYWNID